MFVPGTNAMSAVQLLQPFVVDAKAHTPFVWHHTPAIRPLSLIMPLTVNKGPLLHRWPPAGAVIAMVGRSVSETMQIRFVAELPVLSMATTVILLVPALRLTKRLQLAAPDPLVVSLVARVPLTFTQASPLSPRPASDAVPLNVIRFVPTTWRFTWLVMNRFGASVSRTVRVAGGVLVTLPAMFVTTTS